MCGCIGTTVLMAAADAQYKFTWVDIELRYGCSEKICFCSLLLIVYFIFVIGSMSDGGIWAESALGSALEEGSIDLLQPCFLPNSDIQFPYFFCWG